MRMRGPTTAERIVIDVVEQMMREERMPRIKAYIRRYRVNKITTADLDQTMPKLLAAVDADEGVCLTAWEAQVIWAYASRLELQLKGEYYP